MNYDEWFSRIEPGDEPFYKTCACASFCRGLTLDIGCGNNCATLSRVPNSIGCDLSKIAIYKTKQKGYEGIVCAAEYLPFRNDSFDSVTCLGALEHFADQQMALHEMKRILKLGGRIVLLIELEAPISFFYLYLIQRLKNKLFDRFNRYPLSLSKIKRLCNDLRFDIIHVEEQGVLDY
jgi:ubiquinone/menaquinone biosynthesis C-methylase UbiE